jgi:exopolyphosphatase / guanosine-5'-triphosphate,3'-diphosphate pyrophosphatase
MKLAAIDIGTNSTRLLITDYCNNEPRTLERKMEITRLGRDLDINNNAISDDSARKTLNVLNGYIRDIRNYNVKKYRVIGTSALRKAVNRKDFIFSVEKDTGMKVDVISGKEEAFLSFYGAVKDIKLNFSGIKAGPGSRILVIDVGGGSSEFILGDKNCNIEFTASIDMGCVSLTEKFLYSPGIPDREKTGSMQDYVKEKLKSVAGYIKKLSPVLITGVAGTATTLAAIDLKLKEYDSKKIHGHILSLKRIIEINESLCSVNLEERKKVIGLNPERADIIIGGAAIIIEILRLLDYESIYVSEKDILDGIIYTLINF